MAVPGRDKVDDLGGLLHLLQGGKKSLVGSDALGLGGDVGAHLAGEILILGLFQHIPKSFGLLHLRLHGVDNGVLGLGDGFGQLSVLQFGKVLLLLLAELLKGLFRVGDLLRHAAKLEDRRFLEQFPSKVLGDFFLHLAHGCLKGVCRRRCRLARYLGSRRLLFRDSYRLGWGFGFFLFWRIGILLTLFGLWRFGGSFFRLGYFGGFRGFFFRGLGGFFLRKQGVKILPAAAKVQAALSSENRHEIQVVTHCLFLLLSFWGKKRPQPGPFGLAMVFLSGRISVFVLDGLQRGALTPGDFCSYLGRH